MSIASTTMSAIVAHRGTHDIDGGPTENTIGSLDAAVDRGADSVEGDVVRLRDGTLVIHHDLHVDGIPLRDLTLAELQARTPAPTLADWAGRGVDRGAHLTVELKEAGYEGRVVRELREAGIGSRAALMSFESDAVRALSQLGLEWPVGRLTHAKGPYDPDAAGHVPGLATQHARADGADFLAMNVRQATPTLLDDSRAHQLGTAVWTVDDPTELRRIIADERVDMTITDHVDSALRIRDTLTDSANLATRLLRR